jgi:hypothetical protein
MEDLDNFLADQMKYLALGDPLGRPQKLVEFINSGVIPSEATLNDLKEKLLARYYGYSWDGKSRLLNPWSIISAFISNKLGNYWVDSGTPNFLNTLVTKDFKIHEVFHTESYLTETLNAISWKIQPSRHLIPIRLPNRGPPRK